MPKILVADKLTGNLPLCYYLLTLSHRALTDSDKSAAAISQKFSNLPTLPTPRNGVHLFS